MRKDIEKRVIRVSEEVLFRQNYVSAIDIFVGMGFLQPVHVQDWRKGKIPYLEKVIQGNLGKISHAMKYFRQWAIQKGLKPSETVYLVRSRGQKRELQFSKSGSPEIETAYRTHYVSPLLSEKKLERLKEKLDQVPDLIVFFIVKDSQCSQCKKDLVKGSLLLMDGNEPLCLKCAGLEDLIFLPSGNSILTRHVKKYSAVSAIVVRFNRSRKRYERQGILVQKDALQKAQEKSNLSEDGRHSYDISKLEITKKN